MKKIAIGQRFYKLLVIKHAGKNKYGHNLWKCLCDCGNFKIVKSGDLGNGVKTCGCLRNSSGPDNANYKGGKIEVICSRPGCNNTRMIYPSLKYKTSYCSEKCRIEHRAWIKSGEQNGRFKEKIKVKCDFCGEPLEIWPCKEKSYDKHFCDKDCHAKWKSQNQNGDSNPNYHGVSPEARKIRKRISTAMRKAIRQKKAGRHWESLVDYNLNDLIERLKSTIPDGYSWERDFVEGENILHIDHIIPISAFNFDSPDQIDFKRCFALGNLQLLPAIDNSIKNAKLDGQFQPALQLTI